MTDCRHERVVQSAVSLCELWIAHPATPYEALALGLLMSGGLLLAPCLWLAVQEGVTGPRSLNPCACDDRSP